MIRIISSRFTAYSSSWLPKTAVQGSWRVASSPAMASHAWLTSSIVVMSPVKTTRSGFSESSTSFIMSATIMFFSWSCPRCISVNCAILNSPFLLKFIFSGACCACPHKLASSSALLRIIFFIVITFLNLG